MLQILIPMYSKVWSHTVDIASNLYDRTSEKPAFGRNKDVINDSAFPYCLLWRKIVFHHTRLVTAAML